MKSADINFIRCECGHVNRTHSLWAKRPCLAKGCPCKSYCPKQKENEVQEREGAS